MLQVAKFCVVMAAETKLLLETLPQGDPSFLRGIIPGSCCSWITHKNKAELLSATGSYPAFFHQLLLHSVCVLLLMTSGGLQLFFPINDAGSKALSALCESHGTLKQKRPL